MVGKKLATIAAMVAALAAAGCDIWSGVSRQAELLGRPDYECVQKVIAANEAVVARPLMRKKDGVHITYQVKATGTIAGLYFDEHWSPDTTQLHHGVGVMNGRYSQEDTDVERPIMMSIEQKIEQMCGTTGLRSSIREQCTGVACPSNDPEPGK